MLISMHQVALQVKLDVMLNMFALVIFFLNYRCQWREEGNLIGTMVCSEGEMEPFSLMLQSW